ncbi:MAG TPA: class I SAM-dependent methyltransferase [Candidatus Paceibacterota bacterium]
MELKYHEILYRHELYHWWYRVRRELIHDVLSNYVGKRSDLHLADVGCGTGALSTELERYGQYVGIDMSPQAVEFCKSRGARDVRIGTAEATGCTSNTFDVVTCLDVLEHIPDDTKGIAEIHRILKLGGIAIIFVPTFMFLWGATDKISHHHRRYRLPELVKKFEAEGFTILRQSYFNTLLFPAIAFMRIGVRLLHIQMESDMITGSGMLNTVLYKIFTLERRLLRHINFPFGVSGMLVARKKSE